MTGNIDPLADKPLPPNGMLPRLHYYGRRNGYLYALLSFVGRHSHGAWRIVAPLFTRSKVRKWLRQPGPRIVNLGGGSNVYDRWLTADIDPRADVYVDVVRPLPFETGVVDVVYLEEVIEHVSREQGLSLMNECLRILKPGGILRLTTPDLDAYADRFDGSDDFARTVNDIFYEHGHRHIYSREGIRGLLVNSGFTELRPSSFRDPNSRFGYFDTHPLRFAVSHAELAQYWEALKHG